MQSRFTLVILLALAMASMGCDKMSSPTAPTPPVSPAPTVNVAGSSFRGTAILQSCTSNIVPRFSNDLSWTNLPWPCGTFGLLDVGDSMDVTISTDYTNSGSFSIQYQDPLGGEYTRHFRHLTWRFDSGNRIFDFTAENIYDSSAATLEVKAVGDWDLHGNEFRDIDGVFTVEMVATDDQRAFETWSFSGYRR